MDTAFLINNFIILVVYDDNYNSGQNISNKLLKSSKIGQDLKTLIHTFAHFQTAIAKVWFLDERLGTDYVSNQIIKYSNIS